MSVNKDTLDARTSAAAPADAAVVFRGVFLLGVWILCSARLRVAIGVPTLVSVLLIRLQSASLLAFDSVFAVSALQLLARSDALAKQY